MLLTQKLIFIIRPRRYLLWPDNAQPTKQRKQPGFCKNWVISFVVAPLNAFTPSPAVGLTEPPGRKNTGSNLAAILLRRRFANDFSQNLVQNFLRSLFAQLLRQLNAQLFRITRFPCHRSFNQTLTVQTGHNSLQL